LLKELAVASDTELLQRLAGYKPGHEYHLIVQAEIDRRKNRWPEFRNWLALALSVIALAISLGVALYKS
jgi:hypothetical protein